MRQTGSDFGSRLETAKSNLPIIALGWADDEAARTGPPTSGDVAAVGQALDAALVASACR